LRQVTKIQTSSRHTLKIENPVDYRKDSWIAEAFWDETGGITDSYNIIQMVEEGDTLTEKKLC